MSNILDKPLESVFGYISVLWVPLTLIRGMRGSAAADVAVGLVHSRRTE
jgi:hypothetical protein